MKGFINFIRERGVVGLAVGFIFGGAVSKLISAIVVDLINPLVGLALGVVGDFKNAYLPIASARILYGDLINSLIDFIIISFVVYFGVKILKFDKLDKKKE